MQAAGNSCQHNDFLVINQFKVELTSGRGHVIPDAVCFVNGIPVVVAEFKNPAIENPIEQAINQLLRYSNSDLMRRPQTGLFRKAGN